MKLQNNDLLCFICHKRNWTLIAVEPSDLNEQIHSIFNVKIKIQKHFKICTACEFHLKILHISKFCWSNAKQYDANCVCGIISDKKGVKYKKYFQEIENKYELYINENCEIMKSAEGNNNNNTENSVYLKQLAVKVSSNIQMDKKVLKCKVRLTNLTIDDLKVYKKTNQWPPDKRRRFDIYNELCSGDDSDNNSVEHLRKLQNTVGDQNKKKVTFSDIIEYIPRYLNCTNNNNNNNNINQLLPSAFAKHKIVLNSINSKINEPMNKIEKRKIDEQIKSNEPLSSNLKCNCFSVNLSADDVENNIAECNCNLNKKIRLQKIYEENLFFNSYVLLSNKLANEFLYKINNNDVDNSNDNSNNNNNSSNNNNNTNNNNNNNNINENSTNYNNNGTANFSQLENIENEINSEPNNDSTINEINNHSKYKSKEPERDEVTGSYKEQLNDESKDDMLNIDVHPTEIYSVNGNNHETTSIFETVNGLETVDDSDDNNKLDANFTINNGENICDNASLLSLYNDSQDLSNNSMDDIIMDNNNSSKNLINDDDEEMELVNDVISSKTLNDLNTDAIINETIAINESVNNNLLMTSNDLENFDLNLSNGNPKQSILYDVNLQKSITNDLDDNHSINTYQESEQHDSNVNTSTSKAITTTTTITVPTIPTTIEAANASLNTATTVTTTTTTTTITIPTINTITTTTTTTTTSTDKTDILLKDNLSVYNSNDSFVNDAIEKIRLDLISDID